MIKAVFFDLYNTLFRYEPPREALQAKALQDFGIEVTPDALRWPLVIADEFIYGEIARSSLNQRSKEEQAAIWVEYESVLLREAGIEADETLIRDLLGKMYQFDARLVLYDDVLPVLADLKSRGLLLGLISNVDRDMTPVLKEVGLLSLLSVVVTSQDAGYNKPHPEIFWEALRRAGVPAAEAIYVGDQHQIDVVGANQAGMKGILLDRNGYFEQITHCPRLRSLVEVVEHL